MVATAETAIRLAAQANPTQTDTESMIAFFIFAMIFGIMWGFVCGKIAEGIGFNFALFFGFGFLFGVYAAIITGITAISVSSYRKKHRIPNPAQTNKPAQGNLVRIEAPRLPTAATPPWDAYNNGSFVCPVCNSRVPMNWKICWYCGTLFYESGAPVSADTSHPAEAGPFECPECAAKVIPGSRYCNKCGHALDGPTRKSTVPRPGAQVCPDCGAKLMPGAHFCNACGRLLDSFVNMDDSISELEHKHS